MDGLDPALYGIHSLRAGGATTAAALGVPERLFQRQGGWHSNKARDNCIEESLDSLLLVTRTIQDQTSRILGVIPSCSELFCPYELIFALSSVLMRL